MKKYLILLAALLSVFGVSTFVHATSYPLGGQTYYLAGAGVTATQNTIQLTSFNTPDGTPITMSEIGTVGYGAMGVGTSKLEDVSFTGVTQNSNGTATLTGVTRGVGFNFPYTQTLALELSHAGGSTFTVTNTAQFYYNEFAMMNNSNDFTWPTASSSIATKGYVDGVAFGGILPPASFIAQGVSQLATQVQTASSTVNGSAGVLVIPASNATSTWNSATAPLRVIVSNNSGAIDPGFITSLATTTSVGSIPIVETFQQRQIFSSTGTTTFSVPVGFSKFRIQVQAAGGAGGGITNSCNAMGDGEGGAGGGGGGYSDKIVSLIGTTTVQLFVGSGGAGGTGTGGSGTWSTFGTNGFYASASGGAGGAGAAGSNTGGAGGAGGIGTNGDYNTVGQGGGAVNIIFGGTNLTIANVPSGVGGSSMLGGGAPSVTGTNGTGVNGGNYGGAGSGATCYNDSNTENGGSGAQGIVIVSW